MTIGITYFIQMMEVKLLFAPSEWLFLPALLLNYFVTIFTENIHVNVFFLRIYYNCKKNNAVI